MAAMATAVGAMPRLLSPAPSTSAPVPGPTPPSSFSPRRHQFSPLGASTRHLGSLHLARFARNARNAPAERKSVAVSPPEPEMTPAELKAYEEACSKLEGTQPDFWEGATWNGLGFTIQYLWVFGVVLSIIACLSAVRSYNSGASDFKNTEVFKEAIEYQVNGSEGAGSSVFEESTKEAP